MKESKLTIRQWLLSIKVGKAKLMPPNFKYKSVHSIKGELQRLGHKELIHDVVVDVFGVWKCKQSDINKKNFWFIRKE